MVQGNGGSQFSVLVWDFDGAPDAQEYYLYSREVFGAKSDAIDAAERKFVRGCVGVAVVHDDHCIWSIGFLPDDPIKACKQGF